MRHSWYAWYGEKCLWYKFGNRHRWLGLTHITLQVTAQHPRYLAEQEAAGNTAGSLLTEGGCTRCQSNTETHESWHTGAMATLVWTNVTIVLKCGKPSTPTNLSKKINGRHSSGHLPLTRSVNSKILFKKQPLIKNHIMQLDHFTLLRHG